MKNLMFLTLMLLALTAAAQNNDGRLRTIEVQGRAETEVEPDEIMFIIGIEEYWKEEFEKNKEEKDYRTKVPIAEIEDGLIKDLRAAGIPKDQVKVRNVGNYWRQRGKEFLFSKQLEVVVSDFSKINKLMSLLDAKGVRNMQIGELRHSNMEQLRNQVKVEALKNARAKAALLVESLGEELGEVVTISELNDGGYRPFYGGPMMMKADVEHETIEQIQNIKIEYELRASFRIK